MSYSVQLANEIKKFLDSENWNYDFDSDKGMFKMGVNLQCKLGSSVINILIGDDYFSVYAGINMTADQGCRASVAEFIARANYGLRNGNFELDMRDGEIRYKSYNNCDGIIPGREIIADSIMIPPLMLDRYGNGLLSVMFGIQSPEDAIAACEKK